MVFPLALLVHTISNDFAVVRTQVDSILALPIDSSRIRILATDYQIFAEKKVHHKPVTQEDHLFLVLANISTKEDRYSFEKII